MSMDSNFILIVGPPNSGKLRISKLIQGIKDDKISETREHNSTDSHSGLIHKTKITTKYYTSNVDIFIDEIPSKRTPIFSEDDKINALKKWCNEFFSPEMESLVESLDGIIFTINIKDDSLEYADELLNVVHRVKTLSNEDNLLAVVATTPKGSNGWDKRYFDEIEDIFIEHGFEFIDFDKQGKNEYKESQGKDRIVELIECHEWRYMELIKKTNSEETENEVKEEKSLDELLVKLNEAKEHAKHLSPAEKDKYANEVIKDIEAYI
ncbi:IRC6 [Candida jiufengensis]|uniref:IRC6 n=1 Tax=Candida jiufengensis TaxID=497108 RepID=UPI0022259684|nr:IRC6 [Candida jiufengensis]KAI5955201.1 IRC6 [Candida jiufengensis]